MDGQDLTESLRDSPHPGGDTPASILVTCLLTQPMMGADSSQPGSACSPADTPARHPYRRPALEGHDPAGLPRTASPQGPAWERCSVSACLETSSACPSASEGASACVCTSSHVTSRSPPSPRGLCLMLLHGCVCVRVCLCVVCICVCLLV